MDPGRSSGRKPKARALPAPAFSAPSPRLAPPYGGTSSTWVSTCSPGPAHRPGGADDEDFLAAPLAEMRQLAEFAGVEPDLSFMTDTGADLGPTHTAGGNPMRYSTGRIEFRRDDAWRSQLNTDAPPAPSLPRLRFRCWPTMATSGALPKTAKGPSVGGLVEAAVREPAVGHVCTGSVMLRALYTIRRRCTSPGRPRLACRIVLTGERPRFQVNAMAVGIAREGQDFLRGRLRRRHADRLSRLEDRPRRHPRRLDGLGGIRRGFGSQAPDRAGRRSVLGEAAVRGLP